MIIYGKSDNTARAAEHEHTLGVNILGLAAIFDNSAVFVTRVGVLPVAAQCHICRNVYGVRDDILAHREIYRSSAVLLAVVQSLLYARG